MLQTPRVCSGVSIHLYKHQHSDYYSTSPSLVPLPSSTYGAIGFVAGRRTRENVFNEAKRFFHLQNRDWWVYVDYEKFLVIRNHGIFGVTCDFVAIHLMYGRSLEIGFPSTTHLEIGLTVNSFCSPADTILRTRVCVLVNFIIYLLGE